MKILQLLAQLFGKKAQRPQLASRVRLFVEPLEDREVLSSYVWIGPTSDSFWGTGANWQNLADNSTGTVPGTNDYALFGTLVGSGGACTVDGAYAVDRVIVDDYYAGTITLNTAFSSTGIAALAVSTLFDLQENASLVLVGGSIASGNNFYVGGTVAATLDVVGTPSSLAADGDFVLTDEGNIAVVGGVGGGPNPNPGLIITSDAIEIGGTIAVGGGGTAGILSTVGSLTVIGDSTISLTGFIFGTAAVYSELWFTGTTSESMFDVQGSISLTYGDVYTTNPLELNGGTLSVSGDTFASTIYAAVENDGNIAFAGSAFAGLIITGNYSQGSGGTLEMRISGSGGGDGIFVFGTASLDGTITVTATSTLPSGATWKLIESIGGINGTSIRTTCRPVAGTVSG